MKKGVLYIWIGIILILVGTYYWYTNPADNGASVLSILAGTLIWIYGDIKAGIKIL